MGSGMAGRLLAVFSYGRSGSTWLGSILDSHPEVAYRFEPFARLRGHGSRLAALEKCIRGGDSSEAMLAELYAALLPAHPLLAKPPFFEKSYPLRMRAGRSLLWPLCRRLEPAAGLFSALYTPRGSLPPIAFKEVSATSLIGPLVRSPGLLASYLLRHPCGVVWSQQRGQSRGILPAERHRYLESKLHEHDEALAERFAARVAELPQVVQYALLWRIEVEDDLRQVSARPNVQMIYYESFCASPERETERFFRHFGLSVPEQTTAFLRESTGGARPGRRRRGEIGIDPYYSVFRNTEDTVWSWRKEMPAEMRAAVEDAVADSPVYRMGCDAAGW